MIVIDTNILLYAHQIDSPWRDTAGGVLRPIAEGSKPWALPWPCIHEFYGVVTHTRFKVPSTPEQALGMIAALLSSPSVQRIGESIMHFELLSSLVRSAKLTGAMIRNARIAAICLSHGVREFVCRSRFFPLSSAEGTQPPDWQIISTARSTWNHRMTALLTRHHSR